MKRSYIYIVTVSLFIFLFYNLGNFLVVNDRNSNADAIVMLLGSIGDRSLQTIDLYRNGFAKKIVFVQNLDTEIIKLKEKGYLVQSQTERILEIFRQAGIPSSAIEILYDSSKNTIDEAKSVAKWCVANKRINSILLVTSSYHSARAKNIFQLVLNRSNLNISVSCPLNRYSSYSKRNWFLVSSDVQSTISETCKWTVYLAWSRWFI